jgi:predicted nucleic acid-binding protein
MSEVLVDSSVWIAHFRTPNDALINLLGQDAVLTHPMVLLELACGTPPARHQTLGDLVLLSQCQQASLGEVGDFIEREKLYGLGCGLVDMVLLSSTLITPGATLWTLDKRLDELALRFGVSHGAKLH